MAVLINVVACSQTRNDRLAQLNGNMLTATRSHLPNRRQCGTLRGESTRGSGTKTMLTRDDGIYAFNTNLPSSFLRCDTYRRQETFEYRSMFELPD